MQQQKNGRGGEGGIRTHGTDGGTRPVFDSRLFLPNGLSSVRTVPQVLEPQ